jgi:hypothetical protein
MVEHRARRPQPSVDAISRRDLVVLAPDDQHRSTFLNSIVGERVQRLNTIVGEE